MKKILIVEDDEITQVVLSKYIISDFDFAIASTGEEALVMISKNQFDLIIMDISLGFDGWDGKKTLKFIRRIPNYMNVPIIAQTAHALIGERQKLLAEGFNEYLSKPYNKNELISVINKFINNTTEQI